MAKSEKWLAAMAARKGKGTNQFTKARALGIEIPPGTATGKPGHFRGRIHSDETKLKISKSRIQYLIDNPDMVPYKLNHYTNGRSYPEQYWKEILDKHNISYQEQYPISYYQLDFAILDKKIDLEIDGDQHYLDAKIVESDKRRTQFLESIGWQVIRIKWSDFKKMTNTEKYISDIIKQIS